MLRLVRLVFEALLPSFMRIRMLRWRGAEIGEGCVIKPFTVLDARQLVLGNYVYIGGFNLIHRLKVLEMGSGARLSGFNWLTGAGVGSITFGKNAAATRLHFFEASGDINVGENTIIAGRGTHLFTHGISSTNLDDVRAINIGPWSYIGSASRFVPGSGVSKASFVGMASVVTKHISDEYVLVAGSPAVVKKQLSPDDIYFRRDFLPHEHHPDGFNGK